MELWYQNTNVYNYETTMKPAIIMALTVALTAYLKKKNNRITLSMFIFYNIFSGVYLGSETNDDRTTLTVSFSRQLVKFDS